MVLNQVLDFARISVFDGSKQFVYLVLGVGVPAQPPGEVVEGVGEAAGVDGGAEGALGLHPGVGAPAGRGEGGGAAASGGAERGPLPEQLHLDHLEGPTAQERRTTAGEGWGETDSCWARIGKGKGKYLLDVARINLPTGRN